MTESGDHKPLSSRHERPEGNARSDTNPGRPSRSRTPETIASLDHIRAGELVQFSPLFDGFREERLELLR